MPKCNCLISDSKVIESRKDDLTNVTFRCRKCNACGSNRITIELDYFDLKTSDSTQFINIPWSYFKLAEVKRVETEYEKIEEFIC